MELVFWNKNLEKNLKKNRLILRSGLYRPHAKPASQLTAFGAFVNKREPIV